ncbi:MAG: SsrA-binding protein SmpB, partial [Erysipelotrichaceae bacterium]
VNFKDAYVSIINDEAFIKEMHIASYDHGNRYNHDETRERKLLLNKREIRKLKQKIQQQGYTIIPTKLYLKNGRAKLEIALAKGKKLYDKRNTEKLKDAKREIDRAMKYRY